MLNSNFIRYTLKRIIKGILHVFWIFPIQHNKITLLNELSGTYGDSLKYLDLYIHENRKGKYKIVFKIKKGADIPDTDDIIVKPYTIRYFYEILTSRIIITNGGGVSYLPKRKGQKIIDTWHGGGPYKKTSTDVYDNYWFRKEMLMSSGNTDYILSSSRFFSDIEARSMGYSVAKCIPSGLPRNVLLFEKHDEITRKIREYYSISSESKFILYAPTFRSHTNSSTSEMVSNYIDIDIKTTVKALKERFGCNWVVGIRLHPKIKEVDIRSTDAINCTSYPDMQELLYCADAVITDYSSLMWDYSFTYKPCFLYAPDIDTYEKKRGFYTPVSEWPFPLARNNDELRENILSFDSDIYVEKVKNHHINVGSYEKGNGCRVVMKLIEG